MSALDDMTTSLRESVGTALIQERPFPVVAPTTMEDAAATVRAASEHGFRVLTLGSGSSFSADFAVRHADTVAVMMAKLVGVSALSPFSMRVLSGTPVRAVLRGAPDNARKTIGGWIAGGRGGLQDAAFRALWRQVRFAEVLDSRGEMRRFASSTQTGSGDTWPAEVLIGSRGRSGAIIALELAPPVPVSAPDTDDEPRAARSDGYGEAVILRRELELVMDGDGVFQW